VQELVDRLPEDLPRNPRTIRRDLSALETAGFPLLSERHNGQTRWRLMDGFRDVPALAFSPTELMSLVFSRDLLRPLDGTEIQASLTSAFNKASAALPLQGHEYVHKIERLFHVGLGPHKTYREHRDTIDKLTRAINRARTVQMRYFSASRTATSRREVDPYKLWYANGGLYLVAYCHTRTDVRLFAVERICSMVVTDHPYQFPLGFDLDAYVRDALMVMRGRQIEVELLFDKQTAAWAKDKVWHPSQQLSHLKDGRMRMTLEVGDTQELVGWILSFGSGVRVLQPHGLREKVREEAEKILHPK